jgi:hypothetical protein
MKLSELLEKEGLASVNEKTNISIDNLLKLVDNDFEGLTRVKAMGFLSILKREYEMELDDLKSGIKEYFELHPTDDGEAVLVTIDRAKEESNIIKWLIVLALLGGLWYLYNSNKLGGNLSHTENKENELNDSEILRSGIIKESLVVKEDENKTEVEIQTVKTTPIKNELNSTIEVESNQTIKSTETNTEKNSSSKSESLKEDKKSKEIENDIDKNVEEVLNENESETTDEVVKIDEENTKSVDNTIVNDDEKAEIIYNITVNPRVNLWFGFINLDTKARKEFITTESTPIDVGEQRWLLITGHGRLSVASELTTLKVNDSAKHYFYIDSSEIREINRTEFKTLNNGRGW